MPRQIPQSELDAAIDELNKVRKSWLKRPGVTAVDVGYKIKDDTLTDELAIRVHVRRKLPPEALSKHELFPERVGNFSVDVIEVEYGPQAVESERL
jgi:hypothetical protein